MIALDIFLVVIGVYAVLKGADWMTEGASALARRMNVSEIVIGLTIVAAGTSAPELFVSLMSALKGTPDLAVGNVIGSNAMNTMLIVGVAAMVAPMAISRQTVKKDVPFTVVASVLLVLLCLDNFSAFSIQGNLISRADGLVLLAGFAVFMFITLRMARATGPAPDAGVPTAQKETGAMKAALSMVAGLLLLVVGSNVFVDAATRIATTLGVSESVIGLTIVAGGTSLPELATSVVAARKGQSAIAIGNVIGSNVFNILAILGITATISPMQIGGITLVDLMVMLLSILLLWLFCFTRLRVERWEGAVLTLCYGGYLAWLLYNI